MSSQSLVSSAASSKASLSDSTRSRSRRLKQDIGRSISLRQTSSKQPLHMPIPPSLRASPLLISPQSPFKRCMSTPQPPSDEDEQWLQDTVPLSFDARRPQRKDSAPSPLSRSDSGSSSCGPRATALPLRSMTTPALPSSPPLVRVRQPVAQPKPRSAAGITKTHSESNIPRLAEQGYFDFHST